MRLAVLVVLALLAGGSAAPARGPVPTAVELGGLTLHQYDVAVRVAHDEAGDQHAELGSAWAQAVPNRSPGSTGNTGRSCRSATVLRIWLIGSFPRIVVSPPPGATPEQTRVTAALLRADVRTGTVCLLGVTTGPQHPGATWTRLDPPS